MCDQVCERSLQHAAIPRIRHVLEAQGQAQIASVSGLILACLARPETSFLPSKPVRTVAAARSSDPICLSECMLRIMRLAGLRTARPYAVASIAQALWAEGLKSKPVKSCDMNQLILKSTFLSVQARQCSLFSFSAECAV